MNNKLDTLRDEKGKSYGGGTTKECVEASIHFKGGWNALKVLNLPVLFLTWVLNEEQIKHNFINHEILYYKGNRYTEKELYNYWIQNIYQP